MTPNTVPSIFHIDSATLITEPYLSLSVLERFPEACFLGFLSEEQNYREIRAKQRFQTGNTERSSALACDFREVRDVIVVRIVDGRRGLRLQKQSCRTLRTSFLW